MNREFECVRSERIAMQNDDFRHTFEGGTVVTTTGLRAQGDVFVVRALRSVKTFGNFNAGDDPYSEHDFGAFALDGHKLFWKIDYYDPTMEYGSDDPADPAVTRRLLTVMMAQEW